MFRKLKKFNTKKVILATLFVILGIAAVVVSFYLSKENINFDPRSRAGDGEELLFDTNFSNGVTVGYANTYPDSQDSQCIQRWKEKIPSYDNAKWMFIEISERFYFCDNNETPTMDSSKISYVSPNAGLKKFTSSKNGNIRMEYDTGWEWRTGCNLCKMEHPSISSSPPRYGDPYTNWPHFLVSQVLWKDYVPSQYDQGMNIIPASERVYLNRYDSLIFNANIKLKNSEKSLGIQCPAGDWKPDSCNESVCEGNCDLIPNHALFYVAFVLWRNQKIANGEPNVIYMLLPLMYTEDGQNPVKFNESMVMPDQFGDGVYFAPNVTNSSHRVISPILEKGKWANVNIDVYELSRDALQAFEEKQDLDVLDPKKYHVSIFLAGWEIWGGYKTDVEFNSLSLKGVRHKTSLPIETPTPTPTSTQSPTSSPTPTPVPILTPTPTGLPTPSPTLTPTPPPPKTPGFCFECYRDALFGKEQKWYCVLCDHLDKFNVIYRYRD